MTELDAGAETSVQTFYEGPLFDPLGMRAGLEPLHGVPPYGLSPGEADLRELGLERTSMIARIDPRASFFGDCIRVVDAPEESPLAPGLPVFGWSGSELLEGDALTCSRLHGELEIVFGACEGSLMPFTLAQRTALSGDDSVLVAPEGYELASHRNELTLVSPPTRGVVDLASGRVYDFHLNCRFANTAIDALLEQNPSLDPPPLLFPGAPHAGHALAWFTIADDGPLRLHLAAQMFMPLGAGTREAPLTMPPSSSSRLWRTSFLARNSSLHPFIFASADVSAEVAADQSVRPRSVRGPARGGVGALLRQHEASTVRLLCWPSETCFGDDFGVVSPELGGSALAQSPLFGSLAIQIGRVVDGSAPFTIRLHPPSDAFAPRFTRVMQLLPPGSSPGLVGLHGDLSFPRQMYEQRDLSLSSDPYKVSIGVFDVASGEVRCALLRKYLFQDLMLQLMHVEPRTPSDSFAYLTTGRFRDEEEHLALDLAGALFIPYPVGYNFPLPDGACTVAEEGSRLIPFVRLAALEEAAFAPVADSGSARFKGERHVRGRVASSVELEIEPRKPPADERRVELRLDALATAGRARGCREARGGDRRLTTGELTLQDGTECAYYLTERGPEAQLQIVSTNEAWDLWFAGSVERT